MNLLLTSVPRAALLPLVAALALAGCATPGNVAPKAQLRADTDLGLTASSDALDIARNWWTGFNDPALNGLVDKALADNANLRGVQDRVDRAIAAAAGARAADGLHLDADAEVTRERFSENFIYPPPLGGSTYNIGNLQLKGNWEFDFFGKNRAALAAAIGSQRSAEAETEAARIALASNVARTYFQLARLGEQKKLAQLTLTQRDSLLKLIRQRVDAGLDTSVELRQGEGSIPEVRAQLEALDEQMSLTRHALAVLTSQPPNALDTLTPDLKPVKPVPLPANLPLNLVGHRADVAAARWRVEAATQDVKVARAEFYPDINLTGFFAFNSIGLDSLLKSASRTYGIGPAISLPIFDGGRLRANYQGRTAELDAAVESYNVTVLDAVKDAADQVSSVQSIERQQREQFAAQSAAESAYDLATQRYRAGLGTYLVVLTAETNVIAQRRSAADLKARELDTQVALARALGGGYSATAGTPLAANAPISISSATR